MRRGKLNNKSVIIVVIAGFFALLSFFLDQQVIQKEDTIRNIEIDIQNKIEKVNELSSNSMTVLMLEDRVQMITNYYSFFSTIFYKTSLNLEKDDDFKKNFNKYAKRYVNNFIKYDLIYIMHDLLLIYCLESVVTLATNAKSLRLLHQMLKCVLAWCAQESEQK